MFGYVKPYTPNLLVREHELYKATYCGLCRTMRKTTGPLSALSLSYDLVLLVLVRTLYEEDKTLRFRSRRCIAHPLRSRMMMEKNEQLDYAANASAILAFEKCRDDVADERGWAKIKARLRCFFLKGAYRRAKKHCPGLAEAVRGHLLRLAQKERARTPSVDEVAAVFGDLLADITAYGLEGTQARLAKSIGWQTGRFIYIIDAIDDLAEDAKRGRFNPFLLLYGGPLDEGARQGVQTALLNCLSDLEPAFDLINDNNAPNRSEVLKNILYLGMPATVKRVLTEKKKDKQEDIGENPL